MTASTTTIVPWASESAVRVTALTQANIVCGQLRISCLSPHGSWIRSVMTTEESAFGTASHVDFILDLSVGINFIGEAELVQLKRHQISLGM
jgi:hypothetical protein